MQLSTRGRYAVMAMVELASREGRDSRPVTLSDIAASQHLSLCYLEQLFGGLRRAGLVTSARGPGGGYRLKHPAAEVTIADVLAAVEEPLKTTRCAVTEAGCMAADGIHARCATHDLWDELGRQIQLFLSAVSLDDVISGRVCGRAAMLAAMPGPLVDAA
jgi:Rrf2 family iron-sulfur cluster assembly transcriptional regulator